MKKNVDYIKLYEDKKPIDLTPEEILNLEYTIAAIECGKYKDFNLLQNFEDTAQEVLTYSYEKSARGKTGMKEIQQNCTMKHFVNILFRETKNSILYKMRQPKTQNMIYKTDFMEAPVNEYKTLGDDIANSIEDVRISNNVEYRTDTIDFINSIDDTIIKTFEIRYDDATKCNFSYRNLMKLWFSLDNGKRLTAKEFKDKIYDTRTGKALQEKDIRPLISSFKSYLLENKIFGGIA